MNFFDLLIIIERQENLLITKYIKNNSYERSIILY